MLIRCSTQLSRQQHDSHAKALTTLMQLLLCMSLLITLPTPCRLPNGTAECIDAREVAPAAANETMFVGAWLMQRSVFSHV